MATDATPTISPINRRARRYGTALLRSMAEVRTEASEDLHPLLMETADYWLSMGLVIGTADPDAAQRLLRLIEAEEPERAELGTDAKQFMGRRSREAAEPGLEPLPGGPDGQRRVDAGIRQSPPHRAPSKDDTVAARRHGPGSGGRSGADGAPALGRGACGG